MEIDYTIICSCRFEDYPITLREARKLANRHIKENPGHEIYIDRNINSEIDDTFKSIIIK